MTTPQTCPSCGVAASGRFCFSCGTTLAGASCANCAAPLTAGAKFCHRCGTPAGDAAAAAPARGFVAVMPWAVAAIALLALIALVVGQRFGARGTPVDNTNVDAAAAPPAGAMPRAPDISQLTPEQRAERLYDRIMTESEAGKIENVRTFMPMAIAAYEMLSPMTLDQRYDLGRIGEVGGDSTLARAQADTILTAQPTHLLGLILAAKAARLEKNEKAAQSFDARLMAAESKEKASGAGEYLLHKNDIEAAISAARSVKK
ncbi:MAG: Double zinc ribbon [Gemmatimonadetes bacterium]|nr:Double zinc ribbon [Gemmatimonadota bacterium]